MRLDKFKLLSARKLRSMSWDELIAYRRKCSRLIAVVGSYESLEVKIAGKEVDLYEIRDRATEEMFRRPFNRTTLPILLNIYAKNLDWLHMPPLLIAGLRKLVKELPK